MAVTQAEPRELTPEEQQQRAAKCRALEVRVINAMAQGRAALWELGKALWEFNEQNGWTALGYENQKQWLAQPEIGLTRSEFFRLVRRHREMVIERKIPESVLLELDPSKLDIVMPAITEKKKPIEEILSDLKELGARDLRDVYVPKDVLANGSAPETYGEGEDPDVIDVTPSPVDLGGDPIPADEVGELNPKVSEYLHAASVVDSWIDVGGDRRKAKRNWAKLQREHPLFAAIEVLGRYIEGDDPPEKEEAATGWRVACQYLGIVFEEA